MGPCAPHLANFGGFASPERDAVFDINDFDETNPGPFELDVQRLGRQLRDRGSCPRNSPSKTARASWSTWPGPTGKRWRSSHPWVTSTCCTRGRRHPGPLPSSDAPPDHGRRRSAPSAPWRKASNDNVKALAKLTRRVDGELRINSRPAAARPAAASCCPTPRPTSSAPGWRNGSVPPGEPCSTTGKICSKASAWTDYARKVVGVGSVGTRCWIILLFGKDEDRSAVPADQGGGRVRARALQR